MDYGTYELSDHEKLDIMDEMDRDLVDGGPCRNELPRHYYRALPGEDDVDGGQTGDWNPKVHKRNVVFAFFSLFTFAFDHGTDIALLVEYYTNREMTLFYVSLSFIAVPSLVSGILSVIWYIMDSTKSDQKGTIAERLVTITKIALCFLQLGRLTRQIEYIYCILHSFRLQRHIRKAEEDGNDRHETKILREKEKELRRKAAFEKRDAAILGLVDGFLESALQLLLQLYLTIYLSLPFTFARVSSMCSSLVSTSLIHTSYYRANRKANKDKKSATYLSSAFYFLWRFFELAPRYLLLSLTCALFMPWCFIAVPLHIFFVFILYKFHNPKLKGVCPEHEKYTCISASLKHLFIFMISYLGLFSFVNVKEGKTCRMAVIFYSVFYTENIIMTILVLWYSITHNIVTGWTYTLYAMPIGMICHAAFAAIFYEIFHPNLRKK